YCLCVTVSSAAGGYPPGEGAMRYAVGVDMGGTNIRAGLVSEAGEAGDVEIRPVDATADGDGLVAQVAALVQPLLRRRPAEVGGVGGGVPAPLCGADGRVVAGLSKLEALIGSPFRARRAARMGPPCTLDNDANLILLGEAAYGAARGVANALCL